MTEQALTQSRNVQCSSFVTTRLRIEGWLYRQQHNNLHQVFSICSYPLLWISSQTSFLTDIRFSMRYHSSRFKTFSFFSFPSISLRNYQLFIHFWFPLVFTLTFIPFNFYIFMWIILILLFFFLKLWHVYQNTMQNFPPKLSLYKRITHLWNLTVSHVMVQSFHYFSSNHTALLRKTDYSRNKHVMLTLDAYGSHLMEYI